MKPLWPGKKIEDLPVRQWWKEDPLPPGVVWHTLRHNGPMFPPPYEPLPSKVTILVGGKPLRLTPEQEEPAVWYAKKIGGPHVQKEVFNQNFWKEWKALLGPLNIKSLKEVDFSKIVDYLAQKKEEKKLLSKEEKEAIKQKKEKERLLYGVCLVDGFPEKVGNYMVEPPEIFLGRGIHPRTGVFKNRITPEDVTLNLSEDAPIPPPPKGTHWGKIIHNHSKGWLYKWKVNVEDEGSKSKYVRLSDASRIKGESDRGKFDKARRLNSVITELRRRYHNDFQSSNLITKQTAVAVYLIDFLSIRVGGEKGKNEADTVGCSSLRVEHVITDPTEPGRLTLDFLGKDSMRYYNVVEIDSSVWTTLQKFKMGKRPSDLIFDKISPQHINDYLKDSMPELSAKVFRTYNASMVLQRELGVSKKSDFSSGGDPYKIAYYNAANTTVAVMCNHQRSVTKNFGQQIEKMQTILEGDRAKLKILQKQLKYLRGKGAQPKSTKYTTTKGESKELKLPKTDEKAIEIIKKLEKKIEASEFKVKDKDNTKSVALGTSKINYLDPSYHSSLV